MEYLTNVEASPTQYIPCSVGTTTAACTFCGETGISFPHSCKSKPTKPNYFDPYEALDTIAETVEIDDELDRDDADTIQRQVHALRAYITGMER